MGFEVKSYLNIEGLALRAQRETSAHKRPCVISSEAFNPAKIPPCGRNDELPLEVRANQIGGFGRQFDLLFSRKKRHFGLKRNYLKIKTKS